MMIFPFSQLAISISCFVFFLSQSQFRLLASYPKHSLNSFVNLDAWAIRTTMVTGVTTDTISFAEDVGGTAA